MTFATLEGTAVHLTSRLDYGLSCEVLEQCKTAFFARQPPAQQYTVVIQSIIRALSYCHGKEIILKCVGTSALVGNTSCR